MSGELWRICGLSLLCAVTGMLLTSGILLDSGGMQDGRGILFGLSAALVYASIVILNKRITGVPAYDKTVVQLMAAAIVMIPYLLLTEEWGSVVLTGQTGALLLIMGVVHTGLAYALYFFSFSSLSAQTVALLAYLDPVTALILSALLLKEPMSLWQMVGAVMILLAAMMGDDLFSRRRHKKSDP